VIRAYVAVRVGSFADHSGSDAYQIGILSHRGRVVIADHLPDSEKNYPVPEADALLRAEVLNQTVTRNTGARIGL